MGEYESVRQADLRDESRTNDPLLYRRRDGSFVRLSAYRSNQLRPEFLFAYTPVPGTVFFAGYGSTLDDERFASTIDRVRRRVGEREESEVARRLAALMQEIRPALETAEQGRARATSAETAAGVPATRIVVRERDRVLLVDVADVDWVGADGDYVRIHAAGKSHLIRETMAAMEQRLDPTTFVRIHRSTIVNTTRIREMRPYSSREYAVILNDGTRLRLSRRYRERVRNHFGEFF